MKISIIGTGMVGRAFALRLTDLGHDVVVGTRNVDATRHRTSPDAKGIPAWQFWAKEHPEINLVSFIDAGRFAEIIVNATEGSNTLQALSVVGKDNMKGKIILDLALPLTYSPDDIPRLTFANDDSLGEQIQRTFPDSHVVKSLNTMAYSIMLNPALLPGSHNVFMSAESNDAKSRIKELLMQLGWPDGSIMDLGGIITSRATEMYSTLLFQISKNIGGYNFNISIVK
ncbi:NAD(P)-binding domain-containing protein [Escherichia coli]|uniref:NADPH-dependent F420 reductase n=1 Tax=Enterobacteriaceae TaxID=543 RepID=UPI000885DAF7|nr:MULTISPECIES: NAD(P)-binding domain-containing protein [Enterobacteriaceae]ECF8483034.1 NADP oxidoreductase [Salmonella enterica]EDS7870815.1 NADP oxidoreductase [Salmonella enterica subsp. enterica serovar Oslo]EEZ0186556.1 NADP oxidoreductase [Escherichia coli]EEZ5307707.1 NAD(P)-binding domain-containing protein [Escherichia coli]EIP6955741.1 NAD(P)-binding domain-containing protein [Salmonella enterica]